MLGRYEENEGRKVMQITGGENAVGQGEIGEGRLEAETPDS